MTIQTQMTDGMRRLLDTLKFDNAEQTAQGRRVGGGVLGAARKLQQLGLVTVEGSLVKLVVAKPKAPKAAKKAAKPAKKPAAKKAVKVAKPSMAWPAEFPTKNAIRALLVSDRDARLSAAATIDGRTRSRRPGVKYPEATGWMSSHVAAGTRTAAAVARGEKLSAADDAWLSKAIPMYARQLAHVAREVAIAKNPSLAEIAKVYSLKEAQS
jgi:hypothetical protein